MTISGEKRSFVRRLVAVAAVCLALLLPFAVLPGVAEAHAELEQTVPQANTKLESGPPQVELTFNEAIETEVGSLEVLDSKSNPVTKAEPTVSKDRKSLSLSLPKLVEGVYTVSYQVISADGHPISGSYVFVVGNPPEGVDASAFDPHSQLGHSGHSASTQLTTDQFVLYAVRIVYYAALLLAAGTLLWSALIPWRSGPYGDTLRKWEMFGMRALLVGALLYIFVHSREILRGYPTSEYSRLFLKTDIGREWIALLVVALAGFAILRLGRVPRAIWAAVALGLESWSGHAVVFKPKAVTVLLDFIHLAAASVWAGGLALLLALWIADRKEAGRFAVRFSSAALVSLAALVLTGVLMTLLFLPSLRYLFYTSWGTLLLIKTGLVLLVLVFGGLLHLRLRRGDLPKASLLRADFTVMALIVAVAALFTYVSPLPANEPVYYHKMGTAMHVTLEVSPNKPGVNQFTLRVWLPDKLGKPKAVILRLHSDDRKELGPIDVPLQTLEDQDITSFDGYTKASYSAEGPFVPFAGRWTAEIRVMDKNDNELVENYDFRNY